MKNLKLLFLLLLATSVVSAMEYHVAKTGSDNNNGSSEKPFLTIRAAAQIAQPGDLILVHEGIYRERVIPPRGGESDAKRIVYRVAEGENVEIRGSEVVENWEKLLGNVWKVAIPNSFFGEYNPYKDLIHGDWFNNQGRAHHTGEVYLNGKSLWESATLEGVLNPRPQIEKFDPEGSSYTWFCESDKEYTYIYANFRQFDPNKVLIEINVRKSCFYPEKTGINYITVSGFKMSQAATQWAPPTSEQIGLIGTNWSKGWIIENNIVSDSKCSGITLGKYGDELDNTSENSAKGYVETIKRAITNGWNKDNIGHHIVRNNTISNCEQTGICGSLGGIFSTIENNNIYNIWTKRQFAGAEIGGIKIHASIDMLIKNNRLVNCGRGLWLDWMAQGTRVTGNICYQNDLQDLYVEVDHGPYLVENNLLLSICSIWDMSQGGAYVHNLICGKLNLSPHSRETPYHLPHSTEIAGYHELLGGDNRFFNNLFVRGCRINENQKDPDLKNRLKYGNEDFGLIVYNSSALPTYVDGNVYLNGANPFNGEKNTVESAINPEIGISEEGANVYLDILFDKSLSKVKTQVVTTGLLGKTAISKQLYENPDSSPLKIDLDFFGKKRSKKSPTAGPFENPEVGKQLKLKIW